MMKNGGGMLIWKLLVVFLVLGVAHANIFGNLFGTKPKELPQKEGVKGEEVKYKDVYPLYWKDIDCQPKQDTGRYLLMSKRNGGWNNERMIIENAIIMAWLTNRTLVIPKSLKYDHMHGKESFEKFLELRVARCFVPIVTSDILPKLTNGKIDELYAGAEDHPDVHTFYIEYNNQVFAYPEVPKTQGKLLDDFNNFRSNRGIANQLPATDGTSIVPRVKVQQLENTKRFINSKRPFFCLYYAFYWFQEKSKHDQMIDIIKHGAHYHEMFFDGAYKILKSLGPPGTFSTMHIRARDFRTKTGYYSHFKQKSWIDAMKNLHSHTFERGELVYISTDEKNMTDIKNFQRDLMNELGLPSYTIYDFLDRFSLDPSLQERRWEFWGKKKVDPNDANQFNLNDLGAVEQIVCAHGRRFIGTFFSTFSAHIVRLRGYLPFKTIRDDEHLFWDRSLPFDTACRQNVAPESCEASWSGSFAGSIWASEYEEGWLHFNELKGRRESRRLLPPIEKLPPPSGPSGPSGNHAQEKQKSNDWLSKRIQDRLLTKKPKEEKASQLKTEEKSPEVGKRKSLRELRQEKAEKASMEGGLKKREQKMEEKPASSTKDEALNSRNAFLNNLKKKLNEKK